MPSSGSGEETESPFTKVGFIISTLLLATLVALAVFIYTRDEAPASAAAPTASPKPTAAAATVPPRPAPTGTGTAAGPAGDCPALDSTDQRIPTAAPQGVAWTLFHTAAVPASASAGPAQPRGDVARCYAHTPTGALLAAGQIFYRHLFSPDWRSVARQQLAAGPERDYFVSFMTGLEQQTPVYTEPEPGSVGQLAGFKFASYSPDMATLELVTRFQSGVVQTTLVTLVWESGDWRMKLHPGILEGRPPTITRIAALDGYTPWGGV